MARARQNLDAAASDVLVELDLQGSTATIRSRAASAP
jgi:hypothetical protein